MGALFFIVMVVGLGTVVVMAILLGIAYFAKWYKSLLARHKREVHDRGFQTRRSDPYGESHAAERLKYVDFIKEHGFICMERKCIWPTRVIRPGVNWHLAHDHTRGPWDYLGPAHPECNQWEALERGVWWDGAPTREQLLERVRRRSGAVADPWA